MRQHDAGPLLSGELTPAQNKGGGFAPPFSQTMRIKQLLLRRCPQHIGPHHLVVLVVHDMAVPHVADSVESSVGSKGYWEVPGVSAANGNIRRGPPDHDPGHFAGVHDDGVLPAVLIGQAEASGFLPGGTGRWGGCRRWRRRRVARQVRVRRSQAVRMQHRR